MLNKMEGEESQDMRDLQLGTIITAISLTHEAGRINEDHATNAITAVRYLSKLPQKQNADRPPPAVAVDSEARSVSCLSANTGVASSSSSSSSSSLGSARSAEAPGGGRD